MVRQRVWLPRSADVWALLGLTVLTAAVMTRFFCRVPFGWDPAEYSLCLAGNRLPHSPYILYYLLGEIFALAAAPPVALAALSFVSAVLVLPVFHALAIGLTRRRLDSGCGEEAPRQLAWAATAGLPAAVLFLGESGLQEIYALQTLLILGSMALLTVPRPRPAVGGALYGAALACHSGSLFVLPAALFLVFTIARGAAGGEDGSAFRGAVCRAASWAAAALGVYALFALIVWFLLPPPETAGRLAGYLGYMRGIAPDPDWSLLVDAGRLKASLGGLAARIFPVTDFWRSGGSIGYGGVHLLLALLGGGVLARIGRGLGIFWLLYVLPYLIHETALGRNLDHGLYLPFVVPAAAFLFGAAALIPTVLSEPLRRRVRWPGVGWVWVAVVSLLALVPAGRTVGDLWGLQEQILVRHYSPTTLAALWMRDGLPADAVVIEPRRDAQANILQYYSRRTPVIRSGGALRIFADRGRFTPLNLDSFTPLDTRSLTALVRSGRPVYSFDPDPLAESAAGIDSRHFAWEPAVRIDLAPVAADLVISERVRLELKLPPVPLYRARLSESGD